MTESGWWWRDGSAIVVEEPGVGEDQMLGWLKGLFGGRKPAPAPAPPPDPRIPPPSRAAAKATAVAALTRAVREARRNLAFKTEEANHAREVLAREGSAGRPLGRAVAEVERTGRAERLARNHLASLVEQLRRAEHLPVPGPPYR